MKIFIIAGEPSGDEYGAILMKKLKEKNNSIQFIGIGGELMAKYGLSSMVPLKKMSVMGFAEVIKNISFFFRLQKDIISLIKFEKPDKIILIDYPGLNLRLAAKIKSFTNTKIYYYISPQIWAWKEKRINKIKKYVDHMIVIFNFEVSWYKKRNLNVEYVGHPFLDILDNNNNEAFLDKYGLDLSKPILTLFPGSRNQELNKHLHLFESVAMKLKTKIPTLQILLGLNKNLTLQNKINEKITVIEDEPLKALEIANVAIVASGTATLQAAIMKTRSVVVYKMNPVTWWFAKTFVHIKYASMANIIANKEVFPELIQSNATTKNVYDAVLQMFENKELIAQLEKDLQEINKYIGKKGASQRAAEFILNN
tara:strand:- start:5664 stop:6767 length:1104 start_codon:yes stop_codon:yes gene_type:complete